MKVFMVWQNTWDEDGGWYWRFRKVCGSHDMAIAFIDNEVDEAHSVGVPLESGAFEIEEQEVLT